MSKRGSPEWIKQMQRTVCSGCRQNRYNQGRGYQETPRDAPVTCDHCWNLPDGIYYCRTDKRYYCRHHDRTRPSARSEKLRERRERGTRPWWERR